MENSQLKIICPNCGQPSENIRRLTLIRVIFIFIGAHWQTTKYTMCVKCLREQILSNGLLNILTANVMFPFIVLPWSIIAFLLTFQKGHSQDVVNEVQNAMYRARANQWANASGKVKNDSLSSRLGDLSERKDWQSRNNPPSE
jgi:hypothetical protein